MIYYELNSTKARVPEDEDWSKTMTGYVEALLEQEVLVPVTIDYETAADMILDEIDLAKWWTQANRMKLAKAIVDAATGGDDE